MILQIIHGYARTDRGGDLLVLVANVTGYCVDDYLARLVQLVLLLLLHCVEEAAGYARYAKRLPISPFGKTVMS